MSSNIIKVVLLANICSNVAAEISEKPEKDPGKNLGALIIVVLFALVGGLIIQFCQKFCNKITVPPLVGMIIFGCIARNFFGNFVVNNYPMYWADWIR